MPATTATPVFPISEQYDSFDFYPEMYYAQVLAEAGNRVCSETLKPPSFIKGSLNPIVVRDISSFKPADVGKSAGDAKRKRWWKNALFFWRKLPSRKKQDKEQYGRDMEVQAAISHRSGSKSRSGPIYMNDFHVDQPRRSNGARSGPLSGTLILTQGDFGEIPYVALKHPNPTGVSSSTAPLYLVT